MRYWNFSSIVRKLGEVNPANSRAKSALKVKNDHRSKFSNLSNWKEEAWKNQGFNGIRTRDLRDPGAMLYQLSYEATHWERGQFIEFISPVMGDMMWGIYEIFHIWTTVLGCHDSFFTFIYNRSSNMNYFIYTSLTSMSALACN